MRLTLEGRSSLLPQELSFEGLGSALGAVGKISWLPLPPAAPRCSLSSLRAEAPTSLCQIPWEMGGGPRQGWHRGLGCRGNARLGAGAGWPSPLLSRAPLHPLTKHHDGNAAFNPKQSTSKIWAETL